MPPNLPAAGCEVARPKGEELLEPWPNTEPCPNTSGAAPALLPKGDADVPDAACPKGEAVVPAACPKGEGPDAVLACAKGDTAVAVEA